MNGLHSSNRTTKMRFESFTHSDIDESEVRNVSSDISLSEIESESSEDKEPELITFGQIICLNLQSLSFHNYLGQLLISKR